MLPTVKPFMVLPGEGPLWERVVFQPPGFWMFWIALGLLAVGLVLKRFRLSCGADYILLGFFAWQAWNHTRLLPLFSIAAMVPAANMLLSLERWPGSRRRWTVPALTGSAAIALSIF